MIIIEEYTKKSDFNLLTVITQRCVTRIISAKMLNK
jgi:hypothetical protein